LVLLEEGFTAKIGRYELYMDPEEGLVITQSGREVS
jgi:hypothetical protein